MALEREYETYKANKAAWIGQGHEGHYAVIHHEDLLGFFPDIDAALTAGYEKYGPNEPFMARKLSAVEPVPIVSRRVCNAVHEP